MSIPAYPCPLDDELAALLFGDYASFRDQECRNFRCYRFDTGYVYGLLDTRVHDIFYVGSTVQAPGKRYSDHIGARRLSNFREAWIMSILAAGSLPIFLSLGEFPIVCELELKAREKDTALALRSMGHTALSDDGRRDILTHRLPPIMPIDRSSEQIWCLLENAIAEHLDAVNEQARIMRCLSEMYKG